MVREVLLLLLVIDVPITCHRSYPRVASGRDAQVLFQDVSKTCRLHHTVRMFP